VFFDRIYKNKRKDMKQEELVEFLKGITYVEKAFSGGNGYYYPAYVDMDGNWRDSRFSSLLLSTKSTGKYCELKVEKVKKGLFKKEVEEKTWVDSLRLNDNEGRIIEKFVDDLLKKQDQEKELEFDKLYRDISNEVYKK
jgi:hypothetical protein